MEHIRPKIFSTAFASHKIRVRAQKKDAKLIYSFFACLFSLGYSYSEKLVRMMFLEQKREYIKISFGVSSI